MGIVNPDLTGALHGNDLKPAIETILREFNGSTSTDNLADGAVTTTKIEDAAITNAKINDLNADKITAGKLQSNDTNTYFDLDNNKLVMYDGSNKRVVLNGTSMKVSQAGYDADTASDNQLVMSSDFNMFKIVATGTQELVYAYDSSGDAYTVSETVSHNLGYIPSFQAFVNVDSIRTQLPYIATGSTSPMTPLVYMYATVDDTDITFYVTADNALFDETYTFKYYLMRETAN